MPFVFYTILIIVESEEKCLNVKKAKIIEDTSFEVISSSEIYGNLIEHVWNRYVRDDTIST
jgi:hypothetical protein